MKAFIQRNRDFWTSFPVRNTDQKVLIEEPSVSYITHVNTVFAIILNQAKSYTPVWLYSGAWDIELLKSYIPTAEYARLPKPSWLDELRMISTTVWKFLVMYRTKDILSFSYDGVRYGDIVYDSYLWQNQVATVKKVDPRMLRIIWSCIRRHECVRDLLSSGDFEAVLVSHQVGINSGVILRTALRYGYKGYLRAGQYQSTLQCFEKIDEVYDYEYKPFPEDIDTINATLGPEFDTVYNAVFDKHVSGKSSADARYAFSPDNKYYSDRESFVHDFGLDPGKKNVFVMLHAFNDHPHAHFRWMIFRDYYDWFAQTLSFARTFTKVNWIFKQHPSIRFYPMKDVSFENLFRDVPENVIYISEENQIDTRSLIYCADVVITCAGSAGFELPAMAGIPSIVAADNHYSNLGIALEPRTKEQYFEILSNVHRIDRLAPEQQKRAQAAYMHIYEFSRVRVSACLPLSHEEQNDSNVNNWYWEKVEEFYDTRGEVIRDEIRRYVSEVAKPGFKRLNSLESYRELILKEPVQSVSEHSMNKR